MVVTTRKPTYWRNLFLVGLAGSFAGLLFIVYVGFPILVTKGAARPKRAPVCCYTPSDLGLEYKDVSFTTGDGVTLRGWYIPSKNGAAVIAAHVGAASAINTTHMNMHVIRFFILFLLG